MKKAHSPSKKIPILDIPGHGSFQFLHGNNPEMAMNGTRVTLLFDANETFYELSARYNNNEPVNVLDFVNAQRQLKARMFSMKAGG
ncbi:MAG: hypothetical protein ABSA46_08580 [Thermodesulfovibrionales bacterium]|jgi:hypothetical protein